MSTLAPADPTVATAMYAGQNDRTPVQISGQYPVNGSAVVPPPAHILYEPADGGSERQSQSEACCGSSSSSSDDCNCDCRMKEDVGYRGVYASCFVSVMGMTGAVLALNYGGYIMLPQWTSDCPAGYEISCRMTGGVFRFAFALSSLFFVQLIGTAIYTPFFDMFWPMKHLLFGLFIIGLFFVDASVFDLNGYAWFARIAGFFYLISQQVILLDFAYSWNEWWVRLSDQAESREPGSGKKWLVALVSISVALILGSYATLGVLYAYFRGCADTNAIISLALVSSIIAIGIQLFASNEANLLTSAILTVYAVYICYSAIILNPDTTCNPTLSTGYQTISKSVGMGILIISLTWATSTSAKKIREVLADTWESRTMRLIGVDHNLRHHHQGHPQGHNDQGGYGYGPGIPVAVAEPVPIETTSVPAPYPVPAGQAIPPPTVNGPTNAAYPYPYPGQGTGTGTGAGGGGGAVVGLAGPLPTSARGYPEGYPPAGSPQAPAQAAQGVQGVPYIGGYPVNPNPNPSNSSSPPGPPSGGMMGPVPGSIPGSPPGIVGTQTGMYSATGVPQPQGQGQGQVIQGATEIQGMPGTSINNYPQQPPTPQPVGNLGSAANSPERLLRFKTPGLKQILLEISAMFILVSAYFSMVLTNWATIQESYSLSSAREGAISMWIQATAQWVAMMLYMWSLIAPKLFPDRDFTGRGTEP